MRLLRGLGWLLLGTVAGISLIVLTGLAAALIVYLISLAGP